MTNGLRVEVVRLDLIRLDGGTQSRVEEMDEKIVDQYAELMQDGIELPPISVIDDGESLWLVDGFTRVRASAKNGHAEIKSIIKPGTQADAQWLSFAANKMHGQPRTNADKRRAVELALGHPKAAGMKAREIAKHTGVHHSTVCAIINEQKAAVGIRQEAELSDPAGGAAEQVVPIDLNLDGQTVGNTDALLNHGTASSATSTIAGDRATRMVARRQPAAVASSGGSEQVGASDELEQGTDSHLSAAKGSRPGKSVEILKRDAFDGLGKCIRRIDDLHSATASHARHKRCMGLYRALWNEIDGFKEGDDEADDQF